jgi:signal transduction histidine kinase
MGNKLTYHALEARVKALEKELNSLKEAEKKWRESEDKLQKADKTILRCRKRLKSAQQKYIESERLKVFYQVGSFIVHELKGSISFLSLFTENLLRRFKDDPFLEKSSEAIGNEIKKVQKLIDTLSNLRCDIEPKFEKCDINQLLTHVLDTFPSSPNVKIVTNLGELSLVECDVRRFGLQTVFYNVIKNSFEAMPDGGELLVKTHHIEKKKGDFVRISITDMGYGISADILKEGLFRPFHTTKEKGLGIGLYQCQEIVKRHGGTIEIKSKQNRGTTCIITLPVSQS